MTTLIYCADGNRRFAEIALRRGYLYGACMPGTVYYPPVFTDQDWRKFNRATTVEQRNKLRAEYFSAVERYRPHIATVLDWEREEQLPEVLSWAEQAAQHVTEAVVIIPKVVGGIRRLPRSIGGKQVRLGYSAASTFSGTPVSLSEFDGWSVHCLGGSVHRQLEVSRTVDLQSADGNYIQNLARRNCQFYSPAMPGKNHSWPHLREAGIYIAHDAPYVAFELTCIGVPMRWKGHTAGDIKDAQLAWLSSIGKRPPIEQLRLAI